MQIYLLVLLVFMTIFSAQADLLEDYKRNKLVVIVYGQNASEKEQLLARDLHKVLELDQLNDLYDHIITDEYAIKHQFFYSAFHLIVIGTAESNLLCTNNAEVQIADLRPKEQQVKILPELNLQKNGFHSSYFGFYTEVKGIGFVKRAISPLTLQAFNITDGKINANPYSVTYISGTDTAGLEKAYVNFVDKKMLQGAIIPSEYLGEGNSRFRLSKSSQTIEINQFIDKNFKIKMGEDSLEYKGWVQGTVGDFGGVKQLTGESAEQIVHLKFSGKALQLLTYDEQANTILAIKFKDSATAFKALSQISQKRGLFLKLKESNELMVYPCTNGEQNWYIIQNGSTLYIENFSETWKEPVIKGIKELLPK